MLITTVILSSTAFSQKGTNIDTTQICFDLQTAREITKDLLSGDSAKAELKLVSQQLIETERKVIYKDTIISKLNEKVSNKDVIINDLNSKYDIVDGQNKKLYVQLKTATFVSKLKSYVGGGLLAIAALVIIFK